MKKIYLSILLLCTVCGFSQTVSQAEYFWDNDPGTGNGISLLALDGNFNQVLETVFSNNATLPSIGNHVIGIRVKGQDGNWSSTYRKLFRIVTNSNSNSNAKITQAEYFWDTDPGEGNGTALLALDGNFNQALETVVNDNASLPNPGNHTISIRVKTANGNWGSIYKKVFRVSNNNNSNNAVKTIQAEYFWNSDPGQGNGSALVAFDGNFNQALETIFAPNATLPPAGLNTINIRLKSDDGNWGDVYSKVVGLDISFNDQVVLTLPANGAILVPLDSNFVWEPLSGATTYEYQCATDASFNTIVQSGFANALTIPFSSLAANTIYFWRVRANSSGNVSLWSDVWNFNTNGTLTNPDFEPTPDIVLFPNPAQKLLNIQTDQTIKDIHVFNVLGKRIVIDQSSDKNTINVSNLAKGVYLIRVVFDENKTFSSKFIKE